MKYLALMVLFAVPAFAQHGITVAWTNPTQITGCTINNINVYRALCTSAVTSGSCTHQPFAVIASPAYPATLYKDDVSNPSNPPVAGSSYIYQLTEVAPLTGSTCIGESVPSASLAAGPIPLATGSPTGITAVPY